MNGTTAIAADASMVQEVVQQVGRRIVGQDYMVERLMISLLTGGHVLLEGVPGLAKTLTVKTLSETISTSFSRIQFTPDLLPADVVGTQIYDQSNGKFSVKKGPIFANIILADEINRAPAKVQAALLEAMQEKQVTIGGTTHILEEPFLVLATQNPIEQEGTYPLPEAQVDRFMLKLHVGYPSRDEEKEILRRMASWRADSRRPRRHAQADSRDAPAHRRAVHRRADRRLHRRDRSRHAQPRAGGTRRAEAADRIRRQPARDAFSRAGLPRPRVPSRTSVRDAGRREGDRPRRSPPPRAPHLRS